MSMQGQDTVCLVPTDVILFVLSNWNNYSPSGRKEESQYSRKVPENSFFNRVLL